MNRRVIHGLSGTLPLILAIPPQDPVPPTWSGEIAQIVFNGCTECHRPGEAAPFSLLTYQDARKRGRMLKLVTGSGYMPPWHPVAGHGEFVGERRLEPEQIELIAAWVDGGMPEGDRDEVPPVPEFSAGWQLGIPDVVLTMAQAFPVPDSGPDIYRNFCLPLALEEDQWVSAVEVRPSAREVVHHVLFFRDDQGAARRLDAADPMPGFPGMGFRRSGSLGGWAVGAPPYVLPGGLAMPLPAGSDVVIQVHFHPSGKELEEQTRVGLYFAKEPPDREIVPIQLPPVYGAFAGLEVPAGDPGYPLRDSIVLPTDVELVTVGAHAHYIGKSMRATALLPDGGQRELLYIEAWDFNWQGRYVYREPVVLPEGTRIEVELLYDNSTENPNNPFDPPQTIRWGLESTDEMGAITWIAVATDPAGTERLRRAVRDKFKEARRRGRRVQTDWYAVALRLDKNGDGKLTGNEIPAIYKDRLKPLDSNEDGVFDAEELEALKRLSGSRSNRRRGGRR